MYVRFVSPVALDHGRGQCGLFDAALTIVYDEATCEAIYLPIRAELDWFNAELPRPGDDCFALPSRGASVDRGICWFRAEARDMVRHANWFAVLVSEAGVPIARLHTREPGQILYSDAYQVVAKPDPRTPVLWC
ncbi:MAG: hypothetical protein IBJ13_15685 [Sphingopyxis sp.]|nr:hypothetical protein [Sphingopyxis sp.]